MKKLVFGLFCTVIFAVSVSAQTYQRANLWQTEIDALTEIDRRQTPPSYLAKYLK